MISIIKTEQTAIQCCIDQNIFFNLKYFRADDLILE
jgi:hypothetical protein